MSHPKITLFHSDIVRIHRLELDGQDHDASNNAAYLLIPRSHHEAPVVDYRAKLHTDEVEQLKGVLVTPIVELMENAVSLKTKDLDVQYVQFDYNHHQYVMTLGYVLYVEDTHPDKIVSEMFPHLIDLGGTFLSTDLTPIPEGGFVLNKELAIVNYLEKHDLPIPDDLA